MTTTNQTPSIQEMNRSIALWMEKFEDTREFHNPTVPFDYHSDMDDLIRVVDKIVKMGYTFDPNIQDA